MAKTYQNPPPCGKVIHGMFNQAMRNQMDSPHHAGSRIQWTGNPRPSAIRQIQDKIRGMYRAKHTHDEYSKYPNSLTVCALLLKNPR